MPRSRRRLTYHPGYSTEAELCADIVAWARAGGCRVYPECSGWDIVLEAPTGEQIGVQAKMRPGHKVIAQALAACTPTTGPDIIALAIPLVDVEFDRVALALDMTTIVGIGITPRGYTDFAQWFRAARRRPTTNRCWVPEVEVDIPCGVPGPRTVSPWKIGAVKACARLRAGEQLTRRDFAALGHEGSAWLRRRWVRRIEGTSPVRYELLPIADGGNALPDWQWPELLDALGLPAIRAEC